MKRPWTTYFLAGALGVLSLCLVGTLAVGSSTISPSIFDHAKHAETRPGLVTKDNCESCHKLQGKGANVLPVASVGHKPCLDSGCHASDFISVGESTRKSNPERFNRALAFCRGCHTWEGTGPSPHMAMKPNASYEKGEASDHHVEMDHFAHTKRTECASCHPTHTRLSKPGHSECAGCHDGTEAPAMAQCESCHNTPGKKVYFAKKRKDSEVRTCGSEAHEKTAKRLGQQLSDTPCFQHETPEHRYWSSQPKKRTKTWVRGEPLSCGQCHYMIESSRPWRGLRHKYQSLKDIKSGSVMDNKKDLAHKSCGEMPGCHKSDVNDSSGRAPCKKCHGNKTIESLFG